jgi:hypothetical protein
MYKTTEIYIELLEEGTDSWRPTMAEALGDNLFRVLPTPNYDPYDELWAFLPGSVVRCRKVFDGHFKRDIWIAYEQVENNPAEIAKYTGRAPTILLWDEIKNLLHCQDIENLFANGPALDQYNDESTRLASELSRLTDAQWHYDHIFQLISRFWAESFSLSDSDLVQRRSELERLAKAIYEIGQKRIKYEPKK